MKRSFIITIALIAAIAGPLCASSGWARGLGVLGLGGGAPSGGGSAEYTFIASTLDTDNSGLSASIGVPTGTVAGDLMIVSVIGDAASQAYAVPTGFTNIGSATGGGNFSGIVGYRVYEEGDGSAFTYTSPTGGASIASMITLRKSEGSWVLKDSAVEDPSGTATSITTPSVTTYDNSMAIVIAFNDGQLTVTTAPDGMTERVALSSGSVAVYAYTQDIASAGTHSKSITWSASEQLAAISFVLRAE